MENVHAIELKNSELKDVLIDLGCVLYTYMSEKKVVQSCINSFVVISTSKAQSVFEGLVSILFPILMAVSGYFLSNPLYSFFSKLIKKDGTVGTVCPEGLKALIVLLLFAVASLCVLLITRSNTLLVSPEITDVIEPEN